MENVNISEILNKWFEMKLKTYDKLEHDGSIYLYYDGDEYADIRIDKKYKNIYYSWKLYDEFSEIISLHFIEFEEFMIKWVEDILGLKGLTTVTGGTPPYFSLKIPK